MHTFIIIIVKIIINLDQKIIVMVRIVKVIQIIIIIIIRHFACLKDLMVAT